MGRAAVETLGRRYDLSSSQVDALLALVVNLRDIELPHKLWRPAKAVHKYQVAAVDFVGDSLEALEFEQVRSAKRIADIGSGFGIPALALAAALPDAQFTLLEIDAARCTFLQRVANAMQLTNVAILNLPVEDWQTGGASCDLVTSRNVARLNTIVEWAAPLVRLGGTVVLWTRRRDAEKEADATAAAEATGLRGIEVREMSKRCHLHVFAKVRPTPPEYPRGRKEALHAPIHRPAATAPDVTVPLPCSDHEPRPFWTPRRRRGLGTNRHGPIAKVWRRFGL